MLWIVESSGGTARRLTTHEGMEIYPRLSPDGRWVAFSGEYNGTRQVFVVVTNTLPIPDERRFDKLTCLSIAPLISRAIREVFEDGSVTSLFDGQA